MQINEFEKNIVVGQYECDLNSRMKAGAFMSQCQAISTEHCNSLGLTIEKYHQTNTIFLLAKVSLEIYHEVQVGAKINMITHPSSPNRAVYSRYTSFYDANGLEMAAQDSKWVLVDTLSHKILRNPPAELEFPFNQPAFKEQDFSIEKCNDADYVGAEKVTYSRTDDNGHLNNTQYADVILDNLPLKITAKQIMKKLVINYHCEAMLGESLEIKAKNLGNNKFYVCGFNQQGKRCFESVIYFAEADL